MARPGSRTLEVEAVKPGRVYRVTWRDAADISPAEWVYDHPDPSTVIDTVGMLVRSTGTYHVFAHTIAAHDGSRRGEFAIPRSAVLKSVRLVERV